MIVFTRRAAQQVRDLRRHYESLDRPEATQGLVVALESAWQRITADPGGGLAAPKSGRYWIAYATKGRPIVTAVFYDTANIPER